MYENWRGYNKHNKPDANENNVNSREKKKWIWQFWIDK